MHAVTDELDLLRGLRPAAGGPDPGLVASERDVLMALINESTTPDLAGSEPPPDGTAPRRRRRAWRVGATVAVMGTAAAAG